MTRLFAAIDLPESARDDVSEIYEAIPGAKWTPESQLHLTLRFIGDVTEDTASEIDNALRTIKFEPFTMRLKSVGFFPPRKEPRILWCGIAANENVIRLQKRVERAVLSAGLPHEERKFSPHITVARLNGSPPQKIAGFLCANSLFQTKPFLVTQFSLYSSILKREGALHIREAEYKLSE
ncbi:MAG: RNA 2',3'-cyclic phosphodiesterase [Chitinispirillales bacterium]|jgi:2'-5' RNA ligase|nr:RNA 2',3'-cyclic phosphodiesterase [Chitinispirillales bacterium]